MASSTSSAFVTPVVPLLPRKRTRHPVVNNNKNNNITTRSPTHAAAHHPAGQPATGANARRLAKWLSADWHNRPQAMEAPQFWAHIHVCFRPLPWRLLNSYSLYCESAYDYNLGAPYKTSVVQIVHDGSGNLELVSYKLTEPEELWLGAYEPQLLDGLSPHRLVRLADACNTIYAWDQRRSAYVAAVRPGKLCRIRRGGVEKETYLDSKIMLSRHTYTAWDLGRDPHTDDVIWGPKAGPFIFHPLNRLDHLVPEEQPVAVVDTNPPS